MKNHYLRERTEIGIYVIVAIITLIVFSISSFNISNGLIRNTELSVLVLAFAILIVRISEGFFNEKTIQRIRKAVLILDTALVLDTVLYLVLSCLYMPGTSIPVYAAGLLVIIVTGIVLDINVSSTYKRYK